MSNLINLGLSGLNAAQWGLTTTGQNISNASTPGYTIETPVYAETGGQYTGSGFLPQGVSTVTVTRQYSQYLTTELNNAQSSGGSLSAYNTMISQLNNLVGSPTAGIASAITSYAALSATPSTTLNNTTYTGNGGVNVITLSSIGGGLTFTGTATLTGGSVQTVFAPGTYVTRQYTILRSNGLGGTQILDKVRVGADAGMNSRSCKTGERR